MAGKRETIGFSAPIPRLAVGLSLAAGLLAIPQAFLIADVVAGVVSPSFAPTTGLAAGPALVLIGAILLLRAAADAGSALIAAGASADFRLGLRMDWLGRAARWSPLAIGRPPAGDLAGMLTERAETLEPWATRYPIARARMSVLPVAILLAILPISWAVALLLALAGPIIPVVMSLVGMRAEAESRRQLDEAGNLGGLMLDRLRGLGTLKALGAVERSAATLAEAGDRLRVRTMAVLKIAFLSSAALEFFAAAGVALSALYIGFRLIGWYEFGGDFGFAAGLAMLILAPEFFQPLRDFAAAYHDKAAAQALDRRGQAVFGTEAPLLPGEAPALAPAGLAVALSGIVLRLPGRDRPALDGIDLAIAAGEHVALTGASGAGKSSLLAMIGGLVQPTAGTVLRRGSVGWLGQEPFVMAGSVLRLLDPGGARGIGPDRANEALARVGLAEVVGAMPRGLLTPLGETGAGLSRGELRRLDVARLLLADPDILLADEPTADLDAANAEAVRRALIAAADGRTLIVATHDLDLAGRLARRVPIADGRLEGAA